MSIRKTSTYSCYNKNMYYNNTQKNYRNYITSYSPTTIEVFITIIKTHNYLETWHNYIYY